MKEVLVNHVFNSPDFLLFVCCRGVTAVQVSIQELVVLRLEVFSIDMRRRMAVQELALLGDNIVRESVFCSARTYSILSLYTDDIATISHTKKTTNFS